MITRCITCLALFLGAAPALGGGLLGSGVGWENFSFRPKTDEPTTNFYGYSAHVFGGYSLAQIWDVGLAVQYTPASEKFARIGKADATLLHYGLLTGWRMAQAVYLGVQVGPTRYALQRDAVESDVPGTWQGWAYNVAFAALVPVSKQHFWQLGVSLASVPRMGRLDEETEDTTRQMDQFALSLAYVFNGKGSSRGRDSALFRDFMNSLWD